MRNAAAGRVGARRLRGGRVVALHKAENIGERRLAARSIARASAYLRPHAMRNALVGCAMSTTSVTRTQKARLVENIIGGADRSPIIAEKMPLFARRIALQRLERASNSRRPRLVCCTPPSRSRAHARASNTGRRRFLCTFAPPQRRARWRRRTPSDAAGATRSLLPSGAHRFHSSPSASASLDLRASSAPQACVSLGVSLTAPSARLIGSTHLCSAPFIGALAAAARRHSHLSRIRRRARARAYVSEEASSMRAIVAEARGSFAFCHRPVAHLPSAD